MPGVANAPSRSVESMYHLREAKSPVHLSNAPAHGRFESACFAQGRLSLARSATGVPPESLLHIEQRVQRCSSCVVQRVGDASRPRCQTEESVLCWTCA